MHVSTHLSEPCTTLDSLAVYGLLARPAPHCIQYPNTTNATPVLSILSRHILRITFIRGNRGGDGSSVLCLALLASNVFGRATVDPVNAVAVPVRRPTLPFPRRTPDLFSHVDRLPTVVCLAALRVKH